MKEDKSKEKKKYEKPTLRSQIYTERGALACGKIGDPPDSGPDCVTGGGHIGEGDGMIS